MSELKKKFYEFGIQEESATLEQIQAIGAYSNKKLPVYYTEHLMTYGPLYFEEGLEYPINWSRIDKKSISKTDYENDLKHICKDFLTTTHSASETLDKLEEWKELGKVMPPIGKYVPIAETDNQIHLMLDLSDINYGAVVAWVEQLHSWNEGCSKYIGKVATDFQNFLEYKLTKTD